MSYSHTQHTWVFILTPIFSVIILIQATPREPRAAIASRVLLTYPAHLGIHSHTYLLCHYSNSGSPERQLLHVSYSHTQHTWVFILTPIFSVIILIQATPREPRAAIASRVLLTYPAHLGIHSHTYLLCHYSNSGSPERQLLHVSYSHTQHTWVFILTPIFSVIILIQATPREPRAAIASRVLLTYPAHLGIPIFSVIILIQATPREPRAAIASRVLLTYPAHLGIHSHAYLLCQYSNSSNPSGAPSGNCFKCLTHIPSTPGYSFSRLSSLSLSYFKQPLGSPERQLLHVSYSHTQHTWVFLSSPSLF